ncbi:ATP-binding protein [Streptomyces sp. NPDC057617]|uniref:ATP-binding protein n=1 Tax=Streptomyces sp. NPDC057617 TaxID=3346184 RepID=UPI0036A8B2EB
MTFTFAPATRETAKARIALQGPGGSGKTKTALRFAETLAKGGPIGVVDTERGSALKYAPVPGRPDIEAHEFAHLPMAFCSPENLISAVKAAEEARLAVLIIDSWSHFWAGKGGLLARVDEEAKKAGSGGKFTAWGPVNELEQNMLDALLGFPGHVIVTMRTKNDYEMEGKKVTKVGVKTVQREGAEYEVDVVLDMIEGTGTVTKTRYTGLAGITVHHPGEALAETILEQLGQGVDMVQVILDGLTAEDLTYQGARELHTRASSRGLLTTGTLHPKTGEPTTIGALIAEYGTALKPAPVPAAPADEQPTPAPQQPPAPPSDDMTAAGRSAPTAPSVAREPQEPQQAPVPVTAPQMRMMHALFNKVGMQGRDARLRATSLIIGRPVGSANELLMGEAKDLLDTLTNYSERENPADEFAAMVQGLEDDAAKAAADELYVAAKQSAA